MKQAPVSTRPSVYLELAYPMERKVYRISVKVASSDRTYDRTLVIEPQVSKKNALKQLDKAAKEFAYKVCVRERIESPEKDLSVSRWTNCAASKPRSI